MSITRSKFLELSTVGHSIEAGINFEGVTVDQLTSFLMQTCTNRLYKVDEYSIEGGRILYLASESIGEKAYYLLTAIIKENEGLTQVMLRAVSDKSHGLNGFMNEITADLRHIVNTVQSAHEIGVIRKEQVINIINSVVQRSSFGGSGGEGAASVNIRDSVVQRTTFAEEKDAESVDSTESTLLPNWEDVTSVDTKKRVVQKTKFKDNTKNKINDDKIIEDYSNAVAVTLFIIAFLSPIVIGELGLLLLLFFLLFDIYFILSKSLQFKINKILSK
jgi:hypothetical protein